MNQYVLFVDDEPDNLTLFEAGCADRFPVLTTTSGIEALELLRRYEVAVLLADQRMPKSRASSCSNAPKPSTQRSCACWSRPIPISRPP